MAALYFARRATHVIVCGQEIMKLIHYISINASINLLSIHNVPKGAVVILCSAWNAAHIEMCPIFS